jgi:hypothetical protein
MKPKNLLFSTLLFAAMALQASAAIEQVELRVEGMT